MRELEKRLGIAIFLLAVGACSDASVSPQGDDEGPALEDDSTEESPVSEPDGGSKRDSGARDSGARDASSNDNVVDAGAEPQMADGGRRGDASVPTDATTPRTDAALPTSDAAIPAGETCAPTATWDPMWTAYEDEVLRLSNEARAIGHNCDSEGNFGPTTPLAMEPRLRCAARLYSKLLAESGTFAHTGPDGSTVTDRLADVRYTGARTYGENIAKGQPTPAEVVAGWLDSDGHCRNIMSPSFKEIGVGYFALPASSPRGRSTALWTQDFGGR